MAAIITSADLPEKVTEQVEPTQLDIMLHGANAKASRVAPCLASTDPAPSDDHLAEARLILVGAVTRWSEAGAGALQQQTAGPFTVTTDTRQRGGYNLWPSEIEGLQAICRAGNPNRAFEVDSTPPRTSGHPLWCALYEGLPCSCGVDLAGVPLFGGVG